MNVLILPAIIAVLLYVIKIRQFNNNWKTYPEFRPVSGQHEVSVSVVIAFRNEADNLEDLLASLKKQIYPDSRFEVILVDDHSTDGSDIIVRHFCDRNSNFRYISNEGKLPGKKSALRTGIQSALNEFIITTDADCRMDAHWIAIMASFFYERQPDLIIGLVDIKGQRGFLQGFQETEFLSLIGSGAGSAIGGQPVYCNGANMAFRKSLFTAYADPFNEGVTSGDDTFFLHALKNNRKRILLLKSRSSIVQTFSEPGLSGYINQRIRWVSKSRYYRDRETIFLALLVLVVNVAIISSLGYLIFTGNAGLFIFLFTIKSLSDYVFLKNFLKYFRKKLSFVRFLFYSAIYPLTIGIFAFTGLLWSFKWKGRRVKRYR